MTVLAKELILVYNYMDEQESKKETEILEEPDRMNIIIPQCCREGWPSCPHVFPKQPPKKTNIGL